MGDLKHGWRRVKFGDVVRLSRERCTDPAAQGISRYIGLEHLEPGDLRLRSWGEIAAGTTFTTRVRPGQVLFGKRRAYQRKVAVADFDAVCSGDIYVLESADPPQFLPELLPFVCQTDAFFDHAVGTSAGSLSPRTTWTSLANYEFGLPPREEQARLTEMLATTASAREAHREALRCLGDLRRSTRCHVFTRGIAGSPLVDSEHGPLPSGWTVQPLGRVFEVLDNLRVPLKDAVRSRRHGPYPYYGASGVIDYVDSFIFDEDTLLLTEDGMNLLTRRSPVVYRATGRYWVNNHAHVLRPRSIAMAEFYMELLEYTSYLPYITGTYQKKITRADCERIPLVVPPIQEQQAIAGIFAQMDLAVSCLKSRADSAQRHASLVGRQLEARGDPPDTPPSKPTRMTSLQRP